MQTYNRIDQARDKVRIIMNSEYNKLLSRILISDFLVKASKLFKRNE